MLVRLLYVSTAADTVDLDEFRKILNTAQKNNARRDVTGILAFNSKVFLQGLEGSREAVNELFCALSRDPRHSNVTLLKYEAVSERYWPHWSMGFTAPNANNAALLLRYSTQSTFNPYCMSGENAEKVLLELATQMPPPER